MELQLDLFFERSEINVLREEIDRLKESSANVRRGMFSRFDRLCKDYMHFYFEMEELRAQMSLLRNEK